MEIISSNRRWISMTGKTKHENGAFGQAATVYYLSEALVKWLSLQAA